MVYLTQDKVQELSERTSNGLPTSFIKVLPAEFYEEVKNINPLNNNAFVIQSLENYKNTSNIWNISSKHPHYHSCIKFLFCFSNNIEVNSNAYLMPSYGIAFKLAYKAYCKHREVSTTERSINVALTVYPQFMQEICNSPVLIPYVILPFMCNKEGADFNSLLEKIDLTAGPDLEYTEFTVENVVMDEINHEAINNLINLLGAKNLFSDSLYNTIKANLKLKNDKPVYNSTLAVTDVRCSASIVNSPVENEYEFNVPRFVHNFLEADFEKFRSKWYHPIASMSGKMINEYLMFSREWLFCNGCLLNFWNQLNKFNKGKKDISLNTKDSVTIESVTKDAEPAQQILDDSTPVCGNCSVIFGNYMYKKYNVALFELADEHIKMTDDELFDDWKDYAESVKKGSAEQLINMYETTPYQPKDQVTTIYKSFIEKIWGPKLKPSLVSLLRIKWQEAVDTLFFKPIPKSVPADNKHPIIEHDPAKNEKGVGESYDSGMSVLFRYDPISVYPKQGNYMLQWIISFNPPHNETVQNSVTLDTKRVVIGINHSGSHYGIIDYQRADTEPQSCNIRSTSEVLLQRPLTFLQGTSFSYTSLLEGYWEYKMKDLFAGIIEFLSANGLFAKVEGAQEIQRENTFKREARSISNPYAQKKRNLGKEK